MSSRRTYFALLIAASAVLLAPFFVIEILPLQDYPNPVLSGESRAIGR